MAEDVQGLLSRINQPNLRYLTFSDPEDGPETRPASVESLKGGETDLQASPPPNKGGLLRKYRDTPPRGPVAVPGSDAIPLKPLFAHYARLMQQKTRRRG
ncbi:hypothetical protein P7B02_15635 [Caulobacter segnis]|uniref:hypothetical protein n=1 Tax=Caulobacter segnis TaxID=88688 RepID=UPI00240EE005|nr:hypothetical protein [Caulobacter segnis]MDG2522967.1 hypothetical protein [Caulobacter segnis]